MTFQTEIEAALAKPVDEESEANQFAMCLLMPEEFVRAEVAKMGGISLTNDRKIKALADKFKVPASSMALRLEQLRKI